MIPIPAPMLASTGPTPFTSPDWIYEAEYGGDRCLARTGGGAPTELRTLSGENCAARWPDVTALLAQLPGGPHILDGEICVLDRVDRSGSGCLPAGARRHRGEPGCRPVTFCAFDILYADGRNVMALPLLERKAMLRQLLQPLAGRLVIVGDLPAQPELLEQPVGAANREAIMAKRLDSAYLPGVRTRDWLRIAPPARQERCAGRN